ncbi:hypothetical protein [Yoonia sp. SS1-5]|uniref:Uncharacterized protein n=1 Tax=Yoonia rhodophyticola TaxID=3137370 RepID=A0AAN0MAJ6_9RHOB
MSEERRFFNMQRAVLGALVFPVFPYLIGALANGPGLGKDAVGFGVAMLACGVLGFITGGRSGDSEPSDDEIARAQQQFHEDERDRDTRDAAMGWGSHQSPFGSGRDFH